MTDDEFKRLMAEMDAYAEKGELEYFDGRRWLQWNTGPGKIAGRFRIKPKPRTVQVTYFQDKPVSVFEGVVCWRPDGHTVHTFREVLE